MSRIVILGLLLATATPSAFAQGYPMPGASSADPVLCTTCPFPYTDLPTWPYGEPLTFFSGRYIDSQLTRDYQASFGMRTLRAVRVEVVPDHNRVYMIIGSTFASYDLSTFFTAKLGQTLSPNDYIEDTWRDGNPAESHLRWDGYIYPEGPDSGWQTTVIDLQHFLYDFDTDDRNLVYLAYSEFGWGIVRNETDASLSFVSQTLNNQGMSPSQILSLKVDSNYYAIVSGGGDASLVYDVTDPSAPVPVRALGFGVTSWARTTAHVALITGGKLRIYAAPDLINGESALEEFTATSGTFQMVSSDEEANFFGVENHNNSPLRFSIFSPDEGVFTETKHSNGEQFISFGIRYGSGYLTVWGYDSTFKSDVRLFELNDLVPSEIALNAFFRNYYTAAPAGYAKPASYTDIIRDVLMHNEAGRDYLFYANHGIGDVFEINGTVAPTPTPSPTPTPTPTPTPSPTPSCDAPPTNLQIYISYNGLLSGCGPGGSCTQGESIDFSLQVFDPSYVFGSCHAFEWDFDGVKKNGLGVQHSFTSTGPRDASVKVTVNGASTTISTTVQIRQRRPADFLGAGVSQTVIYRDGAWLTYSNPTGGIWTGQPTPSCIPAPGDFNGDGVTDMSMLCNGAWHFYKSDGTYLKGIWTGNIAGDLPVPADYNGDGVDEVVVYRNGAWLFYDYATGAYIRGVWTGGGPGSIPVPGDYDGDGKADLSVYTGGPWHFFNLDGTYLKGIWTGGDPRDIPVPGDYAVDGLDEVVIFRGGAWLFFDYNTRLLSRGVWTGALSFNGTPLQPAPLDIDGDGTVEFTIMAGGPWHFYNDDGTYLRGVWTGGVLTDQAISRRQHTAP
ncbi:MAG TPA: hypothetical protein VMS12_01565 [Thermoanaerobaculia bacterium]|nr:hypothetical protein [Thermoanaerobaculia bacterium]